MPSANGMTGKSWLPLQTSFSITEPRLMQHLKSTTRDRFDSALAQAEQVRKRYFGLSGKKKPSRVRLPKPAEPVVRAAMKLVV